MLKVLYFSGANQFFQYSLGIKSLYDRRRKFIYLPGRHNIGTAISTELYIMEPTGAHPTRALGQGVLTDDLLFPVTSQKITRKV